MDDRPLELNLFEFLLIATVILIFCFGLGLGIKHGKELSKSEDPTVIIEKPSTEVSEEKLYYLSQQSRFLIVCMEQGQSLKECQNVWTVINQEVSQRND